MPRPKDKTVATTAADADTFLIDGATGVRAMPKTALVSDLANSLPTVTRSARGLVPASGGTSGTTRFFREDLTFATPPAGEGGGSGVVDRFDDRAAIAAAGSISLDVDVVETRSFDASDSTRLGWGRGQYVRTSVPSSEMQTNPGYIHATGDANVSGGSWWRLLTDGGRHLASQFGAKGNGSWQSQNVGTNDYAAIKAAQAFIYAHQTSSGGAPSLHFETGVYRIFDPAPTKALGSSVFTRRFCFLQTRLSTALSSRPTLRCSHKPPRVVQLVKVGMERSSRTSKFVVRPCSRTTTCRQPMACSSAVVAALKIVSSWAGLAMGSTVLVTAVSTQAETQIVLMQGTAWRTGMAAMASILTARTGMLAAVACATVQTMASLGFTIRLSSATLSRTTILQETAFRFTHMEMRTVLAAARS